MTPRILITSRESGVWSADRCIIPGTNRESTEVNFLSKKSDVVSEFAVDLSFAITYHKVQGKTVPRLVLDLNRTPSAMSMTAAMLYVGLTRVTNSKNLKILPLRLNSLSLEHTRSLEYNSGLFDWIENTKPMDPRERRRSDISTIIKQLIIIPQLLFRTIKST